MHRTRTRARSAVAVAAVAALAFVASGCGQQLRAEGDGRDLADAVCDLRNASDAEEAQSATEDIEKQLDDLVKRFGVATGEDRADIQENLADLAEHAVQGNEVLAQQDLEVLRRSADNVRDDSSEVQQAAWTGFYDGVQECTTDSSAGGTIDRPVRPSCSGRTVPLSGWRVRRARS